MDFPASSPKNRQGTDFSQSPPVVLITWRSVIWYGASHGETHHFSIANCWITRGIQRVQYLEHWMVQLKTWNKQHEENQWFTTDLKCFQSWPLVNWSWLDFNALQIGTTATQVAILGPNIQYTLRKSMYIYYIYIYAYSIHIYIYIRIYFYW